MNNFTVHNLNSVDTIFDSMSLSTDNYLSSSFNILNEDPSISQFTPNDISPQFQEINTNSAVFNTDVHERSTSPDSESTLNSFKSDDDYWYDRDDPAFDMADHENDLSVNTESNLEGQAEETVLGDVTGFANSPEFLTGQAAMILPMANQQIMSSLNAGQAEVNRQGQGQFGTDVGHGIVDNANQTNRAIASTVGSSLMFAGLATGDPILGVAGVAAGIAAETVMPSAMSNNNLVPATSGDLIAPQ